MFVNTLCSLMVALPCALDAHLVASNHHILAGEAVLLIIKLEIICMCVWKECLVLQRTVMKWRCRLGRRIVIH